ncbi:MAG: FMN-binding negative transcriptional regulator [Pseudomonadota bacterium]
MHPNPIYRRDREDAATLRFVRERGFGTLSVSVEGRVLTAHAPFVLDTDEKSLELHLMRSNPVVRALERTPDALLVASGPDAYVSPDWYELDQNQVPTWNNVAAHLRGRARLLPAGELRGVLDRLAEANEGRIAGKRPWTLDKSDAAYIERLMRSIVPVRMEVDHIDATWKLAQTKPAQVIRRAAQGVRAAGIGQDVAALGALMETHAAEMERGAA